MLTGLIALLACQLVGELVVRTLDLPVPGAIVGMVLMFVLLQVRRPRAESGLVRGTAALLRYLDDHDIAFGQVLESFNN